MLKWISSWTLFWSIGSIIFLNFPIWFKAQTLWFCLFFHQLNDFSCGDGFSFPFPLEIWNWSCGQAPSLYHEFFVFHVSPITSLMMSQAFSLSHFRINYFCCHLDFSFPQIHLAAFSVISHTDISIYICLCACVTCVCTYILSLI